MSQDKNHQIIQIPDAERQRSWLLRIVTLPKYLGGFIFALIGNNESPTSAKFILGYFVLAGVIVLTLGMIAPETLKTLLQFIFVQ